MTPVEIIQLAVLALCVCAAISMTVICLRNWHEGKYLCADCKYNDPAMCSKSERPKAIDCLAYMPKQAKSDRPKA